MTLIRRSLCLISLVLVSSCTLVSTRVEAISTLPAHEERQTAYIEPFSPEQTKAPDWQQNVATLADVLETRGVDAVSDPAGADLIVKLGYSVDQGHRVTTVRQYPVMGVIGYRSLPANDPQSEEHMIVPVRGVTDHDERKQVETYYIRSLDIQMTDRKTGQTVFTGNGKSKGECPSFAPVAEAIMSAVLKNFPSGTVGDVTLKSHDMFCGP